MKDVTTLIFFLRDTTLIVSMLVFLSLLDI